MEHLPDKTLLEMTYKGYTLSRFQVEAIQAINTNHNVVVSTHTGNGKTLVADYAINKSFKEGTEVIYTAPIKALSNQKYKQLVKEYGREHVGLVTGDRVLHQGARILVMTTEILRNMIHEDPERVKNVRWIILDEIHYINDKNRGSVWEEIIIFKPKSAKIIGLSATIPNLNEFCEWIETIHEEPVTKVYFPRRIVQQQHYYYDKKLGQCSYEDLLKTFDQYYKAQRERNLKNGKEKGKRPRRNNYPQSNHLDFIHFSRRNNIFPVLAFVFSRKRCEIKAKECAGMFDFLNLAEKEQIGELILQHELNYPEITNTKSWLAIKSIVYKGVGFHHAGLLPIIKDFMEVLFEAKLCKVLYATETFAVGINYPVKTTYFDSLWKYDGKNFRTLLGSEYLQMSGRAGRRGIDELGFVYVLSDYRAMEKREFPDISLYSSDEISSRFALTYNTVINLSSHFKSQEITEFFQKSLANFQFDVHLKQQEKGIYALKQKIQSYEKELQISLKCKLNDVQRCPIVYVHNRQALFELKNSKKNSETKQNEQVLLEAKLQIKPYRCKNANNKQCEKAFKLYQKMEQDVRQKEHELSRERLYRPSVLFDKELKRRLIILRELGYIDKENKLLARGQVCSHLHIQELLVTELIFDGFFHEESESYIAAIAATIVNESDTLEDEIEFDYDFSRILQLFNKINQKEIKHKQETSLMFNTGVCGLIFRFCEGEPVDELLEMTEMPEGDFVSLCRRTMDLLRQIKNANPVEDTELQEKLSRTIVRLDRGIVKLGL